jgi:hypothetical protein
MPSGELEARRGESVKAELQALFKALGSTRRGADVLDVAWSAGEGRPSAPATGLASLWVRRRRC